MAIYAGAEQLFKPIELVKLMYNSSLNILFMIQELIQLNQDISEP